MRAIPLEENTHLLFNFGSTDLSTILLEILYRIPGILVAISFHECAHAYAAYKCGDPTSRNLGRMTLNPFAHFDLVGLVMLLLVRFGWAKPVPINSRNFKHPRKDELIVSLAGVGANLIIAFVTLGVIYIVQLFTRIDSLILENILSSMFFINLAFFVFNLLPVPPLDGYHVLQCILGRFTRTGFGFKFFYYVERYGFVILIVVLILNANTGFMSNIVMALWSGMSAIYSAIFGLFL